VAKDVALMTDLCAHLRQLGEPQDVLLRSRSADAQADHVDSVVKILAEGVLFDHFSGRGCGADQAHVDRDGRFAADADDDPS